MIDYKEEAARMLPEAIRIRRELHMHPEPSREEFNTSAMVKERLTSLGIPVRTDMSGPLPGLVADLKGGSPGPTIALRADMDALRIQETGTPEYCSRVDGVMHACGHDAHTATLLSAAEILARHRKELRGNVRFLFESAEEDIGGSQFMIQSGALEGVSAAFGMHVENAYPCGHICIHPGDTMGASDRVTIRITGKTAHGAQPHMGSDAMMCAAHFLTAVQTMMAREKDAFQPAVITFGKIQGGTAANIICGEVELFGICRSLNPETREFLIARLEGLLSGICAAFGTSYTLHRRKSCPALYNNPELASFAHDMAKTHVTGSDRLPEMPHAWLGTESFGYIAEQVPSLFFFLGTRNEEKGITAPLHNSAFDIDESALSTGIAMFVCLAEQYLLRH